ncbi:MAG: alpha-glucosidase/alpha-galactosidase [Kiritimatiellia bacterium]
MAIKAAIIGAGSLTFSRLLIRDILTVPELQDTVFGLTDINRRNLDMITSLAQKDIDHAGVKASLISSTDRREVLRDADYVINASRVGGLEAFRTDVEIPLKYGVDQCVGDTLCMGGIMYGQRNIPAIMDFCRDIIEVSRPGALFLNYANPNAINTWAANAYGGVPTIGLCHGVEGGHAQIAQVIELLVNKGRRKGSSRYKPVRKEDVDIICAGINHQTWYIQVLYEGEDWCDRLLEGFEKHPVYSKTEKVRIDMLRRFGYYTTESNGHVSEYVPWYRKRPREIRKWIEMSSWIHGETAGYLRVCTESRDWFKTDYPKWLKETPKPLTPENRSHEHGSYIIEALETGRVYRGHFNVPNEGCISNLDYDAIVEVPGYVDANGVNIPSVGDLPLGCAAVCSASINVQRLAVEAGMEGNVEMLKQAAMMDPLTGAVCNPAEISQMTDEMLIAQARFLPQYKRAMPGIRKRFKAEKKLGTKSTRGAARKPVSKGAKARGSGSAGRIASGFESVDRSKPARKRAGRKR